MPNRPPLSKAGAKALQGAALLLLALASCAWAGQPLVTDDASIVAPQSCQLEAWIRPSHDERDYWAQPACNPWGNLELSMGLARTRPDQGEASSTIQLQGKTLFLPRGDGEWALGMAAGLARDTGAPHGSSGFQAYYARGLASWYPRSDLEIDLNLGASNVYGSGTFVLAGAALQYAVIKNLQLMGEVFHDSTGHGKYQLGVRYIVVPDRFEAYVSYGNRIDGPSSQWWAILGIRLQTPPFLR
jgi:hypothetical protein